MKPAYRLKILNKVTDAKCNDAGAAWLNPDGSISLKIAPCVVLSENKDEMLYTLFPLDKENK